MAKGDLQNLSLTKQLVSQITTTTGEYTDWRVPTTKELYSLINFTGNQGTGDPSASVPPDDASPFIDTNYFEFEYPSVGRYIDAQYLASTEYVGTVMNGEDAFFGVNFADGRIKGYPQSGGDDWYLRLVRGTTTYGQNDFVDNENGTVTDNATELMWMQDDSGDDQFTNLLSGFTNNDGSLNWEEALEFAENMEYAGYSDWRLPNAKELHTIVDYTRAPDVTNSPAIASIFNSSGIINEAGNDDYPFYWTSTTFESGLDAVIIQFGRSLGYFDVGEGDQFYDVHGAGAQRTDPKTGESYYGFGPQGDVRRVYNYVRPVRNVNDPTGIENEQSDASEIPSEFELQQNYPNPFNPSTQIVISVPESGNYTLEVYNIMGQEVASLLSNPISAGTHTFNFDASNLTSGIYFYNFSGNNFNQTKKNVINEIKQDR